ncbi:MAG TPA: hypothetical protein VGN42_15335 [Pirellulales bacterium]|nr:hypothetical protein [Pirellulales bacterium]
MDKKRQIATVGALVVLTCCVQAWVIERAVAPAQDSLRYLIVAQSMAREGLAETLANQYEQPLFPALVWLTHDALSRLGVIAASDWAASLQWAAAAPLILAIVPLFLLLRILHGPRAALAGCLLFAFVNAVARLGADGLSDSTHLCLCLAALWAVAAYFQTIRLPPLASGPSLPSRRREAGWLLAAGVFSGLALLARAEALVVPAAFFATLALMQCRPRWRLAWDEAATAAVSLAGGLGLVLVGYLSFCGALRPDAAFDRILGRRGAVETEALNVTVRGEPRAANEQRWDLEGTGRLVFGRKDPTTSSRFHGPRAAARRLTEELVQALQYWIGALALFGYWRTRRRTAGPLDRFVQIACLLVLSGGWYIAARSGYLSTRHLLLLIVFAIGWAGAGASALGEMLSAATRGRPHRLSPRAARGAAIAAVVLACLPALARPLHASRINHREAADWLTEHAKQNDVVLDSRGWTALYTGRPTYRYEAAQAAFNDPRLAYVVVEQAELDAASPRGETMRRLLAQAGEPVARFPAPGAKPERDVVVHRWRPQHFQALGDRLHAR